MKVLCLAILFCLNTAVNAVAQITTVVDYEERVTPTETMLKDINPVARESLKASFKSSIRKCQLFFDRINNYYIKQGSISKSATKGTYEGSGAVQTRNDITLSVCVAKSKILKNEGCNCFFESKENKKIKKQLEKSKWILSKENKKILGYQCVKASSLFKNRNLVIFYTKQIKGKASPNEYPFIDGVILEYNDGKRHGIATKISFNQPDIKNFFD